MSTAHHRMLADEEPVEHVDAAQILGINSNPRSTKEGRKRFHSAKTRRKRTSRRKKGQSTEVTVPTPFDGLEKTGDTKVRSILSYRQCKAIRCLTVFGYNEKETASEVGVTVATVKAWMKKPAFINRLVTAERFITANAMESRLALNNEIVQKLYDEFFMRLDRGDLENVPMKDLLDMMTKFSNESRLDDKAAATARVANEGSGPTTINIELGTLSERFNSVRIQRQRTAERFSKLGRQLPPASSSNINTPQVIDAQVVEVKNG